MTELNAQPEASPAEVLRAAATLIRETASHALGIDRPWRYAPGVPSDSVRTESGWEIAYGDDPNNLRWIALMSPDKAEHLFNWLADAEKDVSGAEVVVSKMSDLDEGFDVIKFCDEPDSVRNALAFARLILGGRS